MGAFIFLILVKMSVKIPVFGAYPYRCTDAVKFGTDSSVPNFTPAHRCNVSPLRGEKPQNRPLSRPNLAYIPALALRAMLPVGLTRMLAVNVSFPNLMVARPCAISTI